MMLKHQSYGAPDPPDGLTELDRDRLVQEALDDVAIGIHWVSPDGTIIWANKAELAMLGYSREEYVGRSITEFHADAEVIGDILRRLRANETLQDYEARLLHQDGTIRHVSITSSVYRQDGRFIHTRCFTRDVTRHNNELRQRNREYQQLLEKLPAGAYTCDAQGLITYFNRHAVQVWGREPKLNDARDRYCGSFRLFSADGSPIRHDQCWMALALHDDQAYDAREIIIERPDGSRVTALAHAHPLHDESGRLAGAVNVLVDITERKRGEEAQARLAAIVESADDAIIGKNLDGAITSWNRGAERLFGYPAQEAIGQPVTMLTAPDRADEVSGILERIRRGESIDHYETVRRRRDGTLVEISLSVSPITDMYGRIVGASKIARDITDRKRMEAALRDADRRKDEFLAMLSHELRNPLAPALNALRLLRSDGADPRHDREDHAEALNVLGRQVDTLARLVDDLLDVSRVTTGRIQLHQVDTDLNAILRDVVDSFRPQMAERRHEFSVSLPGEAIWVHADALRLEQVAVNLLANAIKYTADGGRIWLTLSLDTGDGRAVVRVKDSGIGIAPDLLPHVFELFSQGATDLDRAQSGLGIGLALVRSLVHMHGGTVTAESEGLGQGSEFVVRLPTLVPSPEPPRPVPDMRPRPRPKPGSQNGTGLDGERGRRNAAPKVAVADDNPDTVKMLSMILRAKGYDVQAINGDGPAILQAIIESRPDVVILDIGLPGMDGYEVARRIRQVKSLDGIVLAGLTGYSQEQHRRRSREAGFDHHLVKPQGLQELQAIIESARGREPVDND